MRFGRRKRKTPSGLRCFRRVMIGSGFYAGVLPRCVTADGLDQEFVLVAAGFEVGAHPLGRGAAADPGLAGGGVAVLGLERGLGLLRRGRFAPGLQAEIGGAEAIGGDLLLDVGDDFGEFALAQFFGLGLEFGDLLLQLCAGCSDLYDCYG